MNGGLSDWFRPPAVIAIVTSLFGFVSFWTSFDRRVSENATRTSYVEQQLRDHKSDEAVRLAQIEAKIDRILERGGK